MLALRLAATSPTTYPLIASLSYPLPPHLSARQDKNVTQSLWFAGNINRQEAESRITGPGVPGNFLVRQKVNRVNSTGRPFCLSAGDITVTLTPLCHHCATTVTLTPLRYHCATTMTPLCWYAATCSIFAAFSLFRPPGVRRVCPPACV